MKTSKLVKQIKYYATVTILITVSSCVSKQMNTPPLASVFVKKVNMDHLFDLLSYPARVNARINADILSEADGIVTQVAAILGKKVQAHQTLMILNHTDPIYKYAPVNVISPIQGIVSSIDVTHGSHVTSGQKLASVINPLELEIQVQIPAHDLSVVKQGMEGEFKIPGRVGALPVRVIGASPFVDPMTGTALAQLTLLSNTQPDLLPGIQGQTYFKANLHEGFSIPESAVIYKSKDAYVRIVEDSKIKQVHVELGQKQRGQIEILKGLIGGESLVERASRFVGDGETVQVE